MWPGTFTTYGKIQQATFFFFFFGGMGHQIGNFFY